MAHGITVEKAAVGSSSMVAFGELSRLKACAYMQCVGHDAIAKRAGYTLSVLPAGM